VRGGEATSFGKPDRLTPSVLKQLRASTSHTDSLDASLYRVNGCIDFMHSCPPNGSRSRADAHAAARVGRVQRGVGVMAIRLRPVSVIVPAADPHVTTSAVRPGVASVDELPLAIRRASEFATARQPAIRCVDRPFVVFVLRFHPTSSVHPRPRSVGLGGWFAAPRASVLGSTASAFAAALVGPPEIADDAEARDYRQAEPAFDQEVFLAEAAVAPQRQ